MIANTSVEDLFLPTHPEGQPNANANTARARRLELHPLLNQHT
ncbi:hypothetical protein BRCON_2120 [Candidatus Sumerlaea chitinivorans]|uniref:Uncharacterized protein n=1 Tax=Sumerlaea chitinivorans TaxID=2250252 RepID=A0A2Z4Y6N8_SUMC1|nr:hypothetical protein BRCON_2120 [Candidatus Sumerlaea chitinivorans]